MNDRPSSNVGCGNCIFFCYKGDEKKGKKFGQCRFDPPRLYSRPASKVRHSTKTEDPVTLAEVTEIEYEGPPASIGWLLIPEDFWCGRFWNDLLPLPPGMAMPPQRQYE